MKLKASKGEYRVRDIGQVYRITVTNSNGQKHTMTQAALHDIPIFRRDYGKDAVGTPGVFAHDMLAGEGKHKLIFFPAPIRDMEIEVEYFPPRKVL